MSSRSRPLLSLLATLFMVASVASGQTADRYGAINSANRARVTQILSNARVPGASVAVIVDGKMVWSDSFGYSNLESLTPTTRETKFGLGSVSKTLTMVLALRLAELGMLDLDAPVERYLTEFPHKNKGITVRLIGAHLSGYADEFDNANFYNAKRYATTDEALKAIYGEPLAAKAGERSIYGTATYTIIAAVIERVTKRDFSTAMQDFLLKPASLSNTVPNDRRTIIPNRTAFYIRTDSGDVVNGEFVDPSYKIAGAGYLSTAEDLARLGSKLLNNDLLNPQSREEIFRPMATSGGEQTPFALGFRVGKSPDGREFIVQPGGGVGISSILHLDRERKIVVAILTNLTYAPIGDAAFLRSIADSYATK